MSKTLRRIFSLIFLLAILGTMAGDLHHLFEHGSHFICHDETAIHLHELEESCELCDYVLTSFTNDNFEVHYGISWAFRCEIQYPNTVSRILSIELYHLRGPPAIS